ncbi:MAG: phage protein Gp37 [Caulobacteraceae bacterium]
MIGLVENAMLERVKAASASGLLGYDYRTLENWPSNFDKYLESKVRYPACWAAFGGSHKAERIAAGRYRVHSTFALVVGAENVRNEQSRRLGGSASEPGSYQLAEDALQIMGDQTFGLDIDAFEPTSVLPVENADIPALRQISLYAATFATALYYDRAPLSGDVADFVTFHANWDPAPYGHVDADPAAPGVQIPDDPHAVATDTVTLEGPWAP